MGVAASLEAIMRLEDCPSVTVVLAGGYAETPETARVLAELFPSVRIEREAADVENR